MELLMALTSSFSQNYPTEYGGETLVTDISNFPKLLPIFKIPEFQLKPDTLRQLAAAYNANKRKEREKQIEKIETTTIEIKGNWLHLKNLPKKIIPRLDMELSYEVQGAEHSENFKKGTWDGRKHLLRKYDYQDEIHYQCRKGLLERVMLLLKGLKITYSQIYISGGFPKRTINATYQGPHLWKHQKEALVECIRRKSGIISIATGGGKTVLMTRLVESFPHPTNVFINSVDVGRQLYSEFAKNLGSTNVGFIGDSDCDIVPNKINIILLPTAFLALWSSGVLKRWKVKVTPEGKKEYKLKKCTVSTSFYASIVDTILNGKVSFYDECDYLGAETYSAVSACTKSMFNFGFSATPYRNDGKDLEIEAGCGRIIYTISVSDLIDQGVLVPAEIHIYAVPRTIDLKIPTKNGKIPHRYPAIFKACIKENSTRDLMITHIAKEWIDQGLIGIILVNRIDHGKELKKRLKNHGIKAQFIYGQDSSLVRTKAINMLKKRAFDVIVTTLFGRGIDIPELQFGIRVKGEGSKKTNNPNSDVPQFTGRILRKDPNNPNKTKAYIADFLDPYPYLRDHSQDRLDAYHSERGFTVVFKELDLERANEDAYNASLKVAEEEEAAERKAKEEEEEEQEAKHGYCPDCGWPLKIIKNWSPTENEALYCENCPGRKYSSSPTSRW